MYRLIFLFLLLSSFRSCQILLSSPPLCRILEFLRRDCSLPKSAWYPASKTFRCENYFHWVRPFPFMDYMLDSYGTVLARVVKRICRKNMLDWVSFLFLCMHSVSQHWTEIWFSSVVLIAKGESNHTALAMWQWRKRCYMDFHCTKGKY